MLLEPRKKKYAKMQKPKVGSEKKEGKEINGSFGSYLLKCVETGRVSARELEAVRRVLAKRLKKKSLFRIGIFPDHSMVSRPSEVRMGKGKGKVSGWVCLVKAGKVIVEVEGFGLPKEMVYGVLKEAKERVSLKMKIYENKT